LTIFLVLLAKRRWFRKDTLPDGGEGCMEGARRSEEHVARNRLI